MATLQEIEKDRVIIERKGDYLTQPNAYVCYHGKEVSDAYNNCFSGLQDKVDQYWLVGAPGKKDRIKIYNENLAKHDCNSKEYENFNYILDKTLSEKIYNIHKMAGSNNREFDKLQKKILDVEKMFKQCCTLNGGTGQELFIRGMLYANASINFNKLGKAIENCRTPEDISNVYNQLNQQILAAAINGSFSKLFEVTNIISKNNPNQDPQKTDKKIEKTLQDLYSIVAKGDAKTRRNPIDIPKNFMNTADVMALIISLQKHIIKSFDERNLTTDEIMKGLIKPCLESINNTIRNQQQTIEQDQGRIKKPNNY